MISGEAGLGKSRLLSSFMDAAAGAAGPILLSLQCLPTLTNTAMFPYIDLLHRMTGMLDDDPPAMRLARLRSLLTQHGLTDDVTLLLAEMMAIPTEGMPPVLMSPPLRRARTFGAIVTILHRLAAEAPVILVHEDVHWMDQTSLDLLGQIVTSTEAARILIIATTRPGTTLPLAQLDNVTPLPLGRLSHAHSRDMVMVLARNAGIPLPAFEQIVARTDGVPLFVEELTQMVMGGGADLAELPDTLSSLLTTRLDQLGPAKQVAQVGAIIGREFDVALVANVLDVASSMLTERVSALVASGLVQPTGRSNRLIFKHALVQEAAAGSLAPRHRRRLNGQIAQLLIARPETAEPETIARHLAAAGEDLLAATWWLSAARQAIGRGAMVEDRRISATG